MNSRPHRQPAASRFERATGLCPLLAADRIVIEAEDYFRRRLPRDLAPQLAERAERVLTVNRFWRRKFSGTRGGAYLGSFLRHWLASALARQRPALYRRLPDDFKVGHPLPRRA